MIDGRLYDTKYWRVWMVFTRCCWKDITEISNQKILDEILSEQDDCGGVEVYKDMIAAYGFYYENAARTFQFKDMDEIHGLMGRYVMNYIIFHSSPAVDEMIFGKKTQGINLKDFKF